MSERQTLPPTVDRREFFKTAGAGIAAAGRSSSGRRIRAAARGWTEKDKLARIASCSWPIRFIFKSRPGGGRGATPPAPPAAPAAGQPSAPAPPTNRGNAGVSSQEMKQKYGEITMLDFPQFTKDTFPGVTHMDIFSGLFGDVTDDTMFDGRHVRSVEPVGRRSGSTQLARKHGDDRHEGPAHLEQRADESGLGRRRARKAGVEVGKKWLDGGGDARREVDAHELAAGARSEHPAAGGSAIRRRLSARTTTSCRCSTRPSSRTRRWPTTAATSASRSRSRTTGGSPPIR